MNVRMRRWVFALLGLGALSVLLLTAVIVMDPINTGLSALYTNARETGGATFGEFLGAAIITLLILTIPSSHIALLIMAAMWLSRPKSPPEITRQSHCPECGRVVRPDWQVCPYCATDLVDSEE